MAVSNGKSDNLVNTVTEVSDRISNLIREEIELAKAEVGRKAISLMRGTIAVVAGAVFAVFAIFIGLEALAWGINAVIVPGAGSIWEGFAIVFGILAILAILAFVIASRLLSRGPPLPTMAIEEAKQIRETVITKSEVDV